MNYKSYNVLLQLLNSMKDSCNNLSVEFIIVDNSPKKDEIIVSVLRKNFSNFKVVNSKVNLGYAKGVNLGISKSRGEYLAIINPDVIAINDTLAKLHQFIERHENISLIGPKLLTLEGNLHFSCRTFPGPMTLFFKRLPLFNLLPSIKRKVHKHMMFGANHNRSQKVDWVSGSFMFARKKAVEKVGPMDERFFLYMEDVDWCRQFWQNGYEVWYYPGARAIHIASHLSTQFGFWGIFRRISWIHIVSYFKYLWKYRRLFRFHNNH